MHDDVYVARNFDDLNQRILVPIHRIACSELPEHIRTLERVALSHGDACRWSPGMVHIEAPIPQGGELRLGSHPVPKPMTHREKRKARARRKASQARTDRIVRALAFGNTHQERVAKRLAIQQAAITQEQNTILTDRILELQAMVRNLSNQGPKPESARQRILRETREQAREQAGLPPKRKRRKS